MAAGELPRPPGRVTSPRGGVVRGVLAWAGRTSSPAEPWLADHPWRREGLLDESGRDVRNALAGGGVLTLVATLVGVLLLPRVPGDMILVPALVAGAFLADGLWFLGTGVLTLLRRQRHGVPELRLARFPAFLGEPLDATLLRGGARVPLTGLHARLTCVEERWGQSSHFDDAHPRTSMSRRLERREGWSETRPVRGTYGTSIPVRFDLPPAGPGVAGTRLAAELPCYWELELWAELPGLDFHAVFLVPVYARPGLIPPPPPSRASGAPPRPAGGGPGGR
jgi:hypothetical protein